VVEAYSADRAGLPPLDLETECGCDDRRKQEGKTVRGGPRVDDGENVLSLLYYYYRRRAQSANNSIKFTAAEELLSGLQLFIRNPVRGWHALYMYIED